MKILLSIIVFIVLNFYIWTATSGSYTFNLHLNHKGYYNLLTESLLSGKLYLPIEPREELLALEDPYDPQFNWPYKLGDASLYKGKYYLYFGITPVLTIFIPYKFFTGNYLNERLAILFFGFGGFLWSLGLLLHLQRKYFKNIQRWKVALATSVLGFGNVIPFILRPPELYEIPISCGMFFFLGALYLLCTALEKPNFPSLRFLMSGLFFGLCIGARPHMALSIIVIFFAVLLTHRRYNFNHFRKLVIYLFLPFLVCISLQLLYNYLRFDNPLEFGYKYVLTAEDYRKSNHLNVNRLLCGLYFYLFKPPLINSEFPFIHLEPPNSIPYLVESSPQLISCPFKIPPPYRLEKIAGIFSTIPITLLLLLAIVVYFLKNSLNQNIVTQGSTMFPRLEFTLFILPSTIIIIYLSLMDRATMRYLVDFSSVLILGSCVVWFYLDSVLTLKTILNFFAVISSLLSILFALGFSLTGYYDSYRNENPAEYSQLEYKFKFLSELIRTYKD